VADKYNTITSDYPRSWVSYAAKTITLSGGCVDWGVKENTDFFDKINYGRESVLRNIGSISVKLNDIENDAIDLFSQEGINTTGIPISNVYLTTASGALVRLWMAGFN
jgi:hypothetical protein